MGPAGPHPIRQGNEVRNPVMRIWRSRRVTGELCQPVTVPPLGPRSPDRERTSLARAAPNWGSPAPGELWAAALGLRPLIVKRGACRSLSGDGGVAAPSPSADAMRDHGRASARRSWSACDRALVTRPLDQYRMGISASAGPDSGGDLSAARTTPSTRLHSPRTASPPDVAPRGGHRRPPPLADDRPLRGAAAGGGGGGQAAAQGVAGVAGGSRPARRRGAGRCGRRCRQ
jgi:hypothetical protein